MNQRIPKIVLTGILLMPTLGVAQSDEDPTLDEFKSRISKGERSREYSGSLYSHKNLLDLVDEEANRKDQQLAPVTRLDSTPSAIDANDEVEAERHSSPDRGAQQAHNRSSKTLKLEQDPPIDDSVVSAIPSAPDQPEPASTVVQERVPAKDRPSVQRESGGHTARLDPLLVNSGTPITNNMKVSAPTSAKVRFGITIGTEIDVKLVSGANNIQPGYVVFEVMRTVNGYADILPPKSRLFGRPRTVVGDDRLYVEVSKGITPSHEEFRISAFVVGADEKPGLLATVRNDGKSLKRASAETVFSAVDGITDAIAEGNIPVASGKEGVRTLMREKEGEVDNVNGTPAYIVEADIQYASLSVVETF